MKRASQKYFQKKLADPPTCLKAPFSRFAKAPASLQIPRLTFERSVARAAVVLQKIWSIPPSSLPNKTAALRMPIGAQIHTTSWKAANILRIGYMRKSTLYRRNAKTTSPSHTTLDKEIQKAAESAPRESDFYNAQNQERYQRRGRGLMKNGAVQSNGRRHKCEKASLTALSLRPCASRALLLQDLSVYLDRARKTAGERDDTLEDSDYDRQPETGKPG